MPSSAVEIFDHVTQYKDFYTLIVKSNRLIEFQSKLCTVLKELALKDLIAHQPHPTIDRELQASYHAYAIFGMIIEWVQHGFLYSSTYMAEQILIDRGLNQLMKVIFANAKKLRYSTYFTSYKHYLVLREQRFLRKQKISL